MILGLIVSAILVTPVTSSQPITAAAQAAAETLAPTQGLTDRIEVPPASSGTPMCGYIRAYIFSAGPRPRFEREVTCVPFNRPQWKRAQKGGSVHLMPLGAAATQSPDDREHGSR